MNLHDWIDELCDALDAEIDFDESLVLDVAAEAGRGVEQPAAPVTAFLLGYAAAASEGDPAELERLAEAATKLARRWDKSADEVDHEDDDLEVDDDPVDADDADTG